MKTDNKSPSWLSEHLVDVITALLTLIGVFIAYQIPISLNQRDSADRLSAERTSRSEADVAQVNQLLAGVLGEESDEHVNSKRAAARAIAEYAQQGRVYTPATSILFHYLERRGTRRHIVTCTPRSIED